MQKFNNHKSQKNSNEDQQQCFIQNNQQFEKIEKLVLQQSLQLKVAHNIVKEHFPANQLRTVKRPNKMVPRTLFKEVPFYLLPKDLEISGQQKVSTTSINSININFAQPSNDILNKTTNGQIYNNFNEKNQFHNILTQTQSNSFNQSQINNNQLSKKISPKLINKDQLSIYQYFSQLSYKCIYRKYKQNKKNSTVNGAKTVSKVLVQNLNTQKMHCIESLADYNWKAFKQLTSQFYQGYIFQKQQVKNCQQKNKKFLSKITSIINSYTLLSYTVIDYKDKDKIKLLKQNLNQIQEKLSISQKNKKENQIQMLSKPLKLKVSIDSNFQCGNMCYSFIHKDRPKDIYLFLQNDTNTHGYNNWFFFRLRMILEANHSQKQQINLRFHILNLTKNSSMYKQGMLISIFSMKQYVQKGLGWFKGGNNINMMPTAFQRSNHPNDFFISLSFEYTFKFDFCFSDGKTASQEEIYFAMNKPYTYTRLITYLLQYKKFDSNFKEDFSNDIIEQAQQKQQIQEKSQQIALKRKSQNYKDNQDKQEINQDAFININTNSSICHISISDDQEDQQINQNLESFIKIEDSSIENLKINQIKNQISSQIKPPELNQNFQFFVDVKNIGYTLSNNIIPVMTIGLGKKQEILKRKIILFLGRQHPSQTMGSFVTQGIMNFFKLSSISHQQKRQQQFPFDQQTSKYSHQSIFLMRNYQIVFIPMINPDGVIHGNSRCNFAGLDLNRRWDQQSLKELTPQTFRVRSFILQLHKRSKILFMIDLHGHGKKLNSFIFACKTQKNQQKDKQTYRLFNYAMSKLEPRFSMTSCTYGIQRDKINTIRNQLYQCGVSHCYTLQNSFYGYNIGSKIKHYSQRDFFEIGKSVVLGIYIILSFDSVFQRQFCMKKHGFNKQSLIQQLSIMADKFDKQQKFSLNDKQIQSDSDPQGDVLNVQQRMIVIKTNSKTLSKKVKDSFSLTTGFSLSKSKKGKGVKNSKLGTKKQITETNKILKPQVINQKQKVKAQNLQNLQFQKDSDQQIQNEIKNQKNKKNKNKSEVVHIINPGKVNNFMGKSNRWTYKQKWSSKNISQDLKDAHQTVIIEKNIDNNQNKNDINLKQTLLMFQKSNFKQKTNKISIFYQKNKKKYLKRPKIKTQAQIADPQNQHIQNQQKIHFQKEQIPNTVLNYDNSYRRNSSKTRFITEDLTLKKQKDLKYKMLKQQSLKALLTDSLSILKMDPQRKGTKPIEMSQKKRKLYSNHISMNKKMSKQLLQATYEKSNRSLIYSSKMTKSKLQSKQKFEAHGRVFSQHQNRVQTQPCSNKEYIQAKDADLNIKKFKRFQSFVQDKSYHLFHKQSKAQNNSVFYYFPVL